MLRLRLSHCLHRDTQQVARRNDQAQGRSIQLAVGQMGMGRAAERYEILNACPSLPAVLVCRGGDAWPPCALINPSAKFLGNKDVRGGALVLARLICTRCRADVESVLRCRRCGALCPTSEIGTAMLSPSAFVFYVLVLDGDCDILVWLIFQQPAGSRRPSLSRTSAPPSS